MTRARWPKECPVFLCIDGNEHWKGTIVEMLEVDPQPMAPGSPITDYRVRHHCRLTGWAHEGWLSMPHQSLRPLTPAAREMLALVKP